MLSPPGIRAHPCRRAAQGITLSCASPKLSMCLRHKRHVIVFADALKHQECCGTIARISYKMGPLWRDGIRVTGTKQHFLLRLTKEQPQLSFNDVKSVLDVAVAMPGHGLSGRDLKFRDAEAGTFGVISPPLYFIKMAGIFHPWH